MNIQTGKHIVETYGNDKLILTRKEYFNNILNKVTTFYKGCCHSIDDNPSEIEYFSDGSIFKESWHYEGALHRKLNQPSFICYYKGNAIIRQFFIYGKYHRTDGPAYEIRIVNDKLNIDLSRSWCALNDNVINSSSVMKVIDTNIFFISISSYNILYKTVFLLKRVIKKYKQRKRLQLYDTLSNITIKQNKGLYLVGNDILKLIPSYIY